MKVQNKTIYEAMKWVNNEAETDAFLSDLEKVNNITSSDQYRVHVDHRWPEHSFLIIDSNFQLHRVHLGYYIVKDEDGCIRAFDPDEFNETFEVIEQ